jgi:hypothetical protein
VSCQVHKNVGSPEIYWSFEPLCGSAIGVINYLHHAVNVYGVSSAFSLFEIFDVLTSNQVGLPAELKHINKRRKRN